MGAPPNSPLGAGHCVQLCRDDALRIDNPEQGIVSLRLNSTETTIGLDSGTYRLHIENLASGDGWMVAEGSFTISR